MKKIICALICLLLLGGLFPAGNAMAGTNVNTTAYVAPANKGSLNVRADPRIDAKILDVLDYGTQVTVLEYIDNVWVRVLFVKGTRTSIGYVMIQHLKFNKPGSGNGSGTSTGTQGSYSFSTFVKVTPYKAYAKPTRSTGWVNLRWAPGMNAEVISRCYMNKEVVVIARNSGWAQVLDVDNCTVGFMDRRYLSETGSNVSVRCEDRR